MTDCYFDEEKIAEWEVRFPDLLTTVNAANSLPELTKIWKHVNKAYFNDTLEYSACSGAIDAFVQNRRAYLEGLGESHTSQEAREDRILHIRTSDGKRTARKWN